jgi:hypothetical protein
MSELKDGCQYVINFYINGSNSRQEEISVYDASCDCFFVDGDESHGIPNDCVDEWKEVT